MVQTWGSPDASSIESSAFAVHYDPEAAGALHHLAVAQGASRLAVSSAMAFYDSQGLFASLGARADQSARIEQVATYELLLRAGYGSLAAVYAQFAPYARTNRQAHD